MATWSCNKIKEIKCPKCGAIGIIPIWIKPIDLPIKCWQCSYIFRETFKETLNEKLDGSS